ncbi:protein of unknown function (plasmid) [Pseudorhizobium banfieldiae]|uniref:Uncharacterized protein n=1 Tax=Pseudorhizobium banfieldiae TaxID=1125847 RepID=L0NN42_9HYPH|nr:protein of unknown function [Pseudorhizobium banfieldiae]
MCRRMVGLRGYKPRLGDMHPAKPVRLSYM